MNSASRLIDLMKITTPIMLGTAFQVETAQTTACSAAILTWLSAGILGGFVIGPTRHGKTCAVRWAVKALVKALGIRMFAYHIPLRSHVEAKEGEFFEYLLSALKHRDWQSGSAGKKRNRLMDFLATKARRCPLKIVILHFDEAQHLLDQHWKWIQDIENEAGERKIKVFYLFSGPAELEQIKERYVRRGMSNVVGRFMSKTFYLTGLETEEALKGCLEGFDSCVYPESQGLRLVAHCVDLKARPDFSLASYAPRMWKEFQIIRAEEFPGARADDMVLPMHYVTSAVLQFLTGLAIDEEGLSDEVLLRNAVQASGISDFIRSTTFQGEESSMGERE